MARQVQLSAKDDSAARLQGVRFSTRVLDFLVENGVRLDDPNNKLMFVKLTATDLTYDAIAVYDVHQWSSIGRVQVSSIYIAERLQKMVQ